MHSKGFGNYVGQFGSVDIPNGCLILRYDIIFILMV